MLRHRGSRRRGTVGRNATKGQRGNEIKKQRDRNAKETKRQRGQGDKETKETKETKRQKRQNAPSTNVSQLLLGHHFDVLAKIFAVKNCAYVSFHNNFRIHPWTALLYWFLVVLLQILLLRKGGAYWYRKLVKNPYPWIPATRVEP